MKAKFCTATITRRFTQAMKLTMVIAIAWTKVTSLVHQPARAIHFTVSTKDTESHKFPLAELTMVHLNVHINSILILINFLAHTIPCSSSATGVCDCCDGSDEGNLVKCGNQCAATAANERLMMERLTSAYRIGSVIRTADVQRIEKKKSNLLSEIEPFKIAIEEKKKTVEDLREVSDIVESNYEEAHTRANEKMMVIAGDLLGIQNISDQQLAKLLSSLLTTIAMSEGDLKNIVRDAGIEPFESLHHDNKNRPDDEREVDIEDYSEEVDGDDIIPAAEDTNMEELNSISATKKIPYHCTLLNYVDDIRLQVLCTHAPNGDEISSSIEEARAASIAVDNAKRVLIQLIKSRDIYTEIQLLIGFNRMTGSYDGSLEFVKSHKELLDPRSCPADWAGSKEVNDLCSLGDNLMKSFDTLRHLPEKDKQPEINLTAGEDDLKEYENQLLTTETELKEINEYSEFLEYLALKDSCLKGHDGKFTYDVCILDKLTQTDGEDASTEVTLGVFNSIENNVNTGGVIMHFTEGTNCWAFGPRTADVFINCGPEQKMISSNEPTTCYYTFEVESPSGCTEKFAQMNGIETD